MDNTSYTDYTSYTEYKIAEYIWKIVPPILIALGTFGNVLSIIVLTRKQMRTSTTSLYLTVLAGSDLIVLYSGLLRQWMAYVFDMDIRKVSSVSCKINHWVLNTFLNFSAWILIGVTVERVISVMFPYKYKTACSKKVALAFMCSSLLFLMLLNSHFLYGFGHFVVANNNNSTVRQFKCGINNPAYYIFKYHMWTYIDLFVFLVVPGTFILVGNCMILFNVTKKRRHVSRRVSPGLSTTIMRRQQSLLGRHTMTALLVTLSCVFLACTLPITVYTVGQPTWENKAMMNYDHHTIAVLRLWWAVVNTLMYVNNSVNFFLYCFSGTKIRQEIKVMFCNSVKWRRLGTCCITPLSVIFAKCITSPELTSLDESETIQDIASEPKRYRLEHNQDALSQSGFPSITTIV